jgi:hypothetical protein
VPEPPLEPDPESELEPPPAPTPPLDFEPCRCLESLVAVAVVDCGAAELDDVVELVVLGAVALPAEACAVLDELDDDPQPARPAAAQHITTAKSVLTGTIHYLARVCGALLLVLL